jgi:hypothetical protein
MSSLLSCSQHVSIRDLVRSWQNVGENVFLNSNVRLASIIDACQSSDTCLLSASHRWEYRNSPITRLCYISRSKEDEVRWTLEQHAIDLTIEARTSFRRTVKVTVAMPSVLKIAFSTSWIQCHTANDAHRISLSSQMMEACIKFMWLAVDRDLSSRTAW